MKKLYFLIVGVLLSSALRSQPPVRISWAGELNGEPCQLDSVVVINKSNGEKVVFYHPETEFIISSVGITPIEPEAETGLKTYPNPFSDKVQAEFSLPQNGEVDLAVYDMLGREIIRQVKVLERGTHRFDLSLPYGMYTLSLQTVAGKQSVRLASENSENTAPQIIYVMRHCEARSADKAERMGEVKKQKSNDDLPFKYGDTVVMQGFISDSNVFQYSEEYIVPLTKDAHILFAFTVEDTFAAKVLMLMVDYLTYTFQGGKELVFDNNSDSFTITHQYFEPMIISDFKLFYAEIGELLFHGTVMRMAEGDMIFPENLLHPYQFQATNTNDTMLPQNGFEIVFDYYDIAFEDYFHANPDFAWNSVQSLAIVRKYLQSNPTQKVKIAIYTRGIGLVNPLTTSWIILLKK